LLRFAFIIVLCFVLPKLLSMLLKVRFISVLNLIISIVFPAYLIILAISIPKSFPLWEKSILITPLAISSLFFVVLYLYEDLKHKKINIYKSLKIYIKNPIGYIFAGSFYTAYVGVSILPTIHYLFLTEPILVFRLVSLLVVWVLYIWVGFGIYLSIKQ